LKSEDSQIQENGRS